MIKHLFPGNGEWPRLYNVFGQVRENNPDDATMTSSEAILVLDSNYRKSCRCKVRKQHHLFQATKFNQDNMKKTKDNLKHDACCQFIRIIK